jgi:hypothetical protein
MINLELKSHSSIDQQHLERSFSHVPEQGGLRRATLRRTLNRPKRHLAAVMFYNLSLLMRHLIGHGIRNSGSLWPGRTFSGTSATF